MSNYIRASLDGFNAITDTNKDNYSLYGDEDNVLIKELMTDSQNIPEYNQLVTIPHNLGYIPLAFVWAWLSSSDSHWSHITNQYNPFVVPQVIQAVDTQNLYIYNFGGRGSDLPVFSRIFYDDMTELNALQYDSGYLSPGSMSNDGSIGTVSWSNENNAKVSDDNYATVTLNSNTSNWLKANNFGFSIPAEATITGIHASIEAKSDGPAGWVMDYIRIVKSGAIKSTNHQVTLPAGSDTTQYVGGSQYKWGESWTASDINDPGFGIAIATFKSTAGNRLVSIDQVRLRVFYTLPGSPEIVESPGVIKVARPDKNAESTNPNDFIMHSQLNNLKILYQNSGSISLSTGLNTFAHGADIDSPYQCLVFLKFPDGYTTLCGLCKTYSFDESKYVEKVTADGTNIHITSSGNFDVEISYLFFGKGKDGLYTPGGPTIAVTQDGFNALTDTNPDHYNFLSKFPTLKYYESGDYSMGSVNTTTVQLIPHGLGYVPFFAGYVSDLNQFNIFNNNSEPVYALTPYFLARSTFISPDQDVGAFIYADNDYLYLKAFFQSGALGTNFPFDKFYYKIFRNNLGI